jgi:outer membrane protein TolC
MSKKILGVFLFLFLSLFLLCRYSWAQEPSVSPPPQEPEKPAITAPAEPTPPAVTAPQEPEKPAVTTPVEPTPPAVTAPAEPEKPAVTAPKEPEKPAVTAPAEPEKPAVTAPKEPEKPAPPPLRVEIKKYPVPDDIDRAPAPPQELRAITLDDAIKIALMNNRSILQSREGIEVAKSNELAAVSSFLPQANMVGTYLKRDGTVLTGTSPTSTAVSKNETYNGTIQVKENIFAGGQSLMALKQSDISLKSSGEALRQTVQGTVFAVKQAFYGVLLAQETVKVAEAAVSQAEEHLRLGRSRFAAGTVSRFDVLRSEVEVANAKPNLIKAKNALKNANETFKKVLGVDLRYELRLAGELKFEPMEADMASSISRALAARPEIKQTRYQESIQKLNVSSAYARLSPTLDFVANFNRAAAAGHAPSNPNDWAYNWNTSFVLTWNIFEGGLTYSKIWGARANMRSAEWARIDQEESVKVEVKNAIWSLEESRERIESQAKNVEQAEESLRLAQVRYQNGVGTNVEVIDSEVALTQARTNYIQALYDYSVAKANWERVVGKD